MATATTTTHRGKWDYLWVTTCIVPPVTFTTRVVVGDRGGGDGGVGGCGGGCWRGATPIIATTTTITIADAIAAASPILCGAWSQCSLLGVYVVVRVSELGKVRSSWQMNHLLH